MHLPPLDAPRSEANDPCSQRPCIYKRRVLMQRLRIFLLFFVACLATAILAQAPAFSPKPDPELKKLARYVGQWSYEGEYKPGPLGPASKATGDATCKMILRRFFLEWRWREQGITGETRGFEILRYDPTNKKYPSSAYADDGSLMVGAYALDGNTSIFSGKLVVGEKQYPFKVTEVFATDLKSFTQKAEISADGNAWTPFFEAHYTKTNATPKK